jgi:GNS1/SUR4 family
MIILGYIGAKWLPGGPALVLGVVNCIVHSVMYFYYFLTAFKPELKQSIWWKKHITQIQLLQFSILVVNFTRACFAENCNFPKFFSWVMLLQNTFMLFIFSDFYIKVYLKKGKKNLQ